jgi:interferon-induced GTP-binding protein Mx
MAESSLTMALARDIRPAVDLVDGLRSCGVDRDIAVPQVIVVGDQSCGKSSVIEAVCGVPLPRGAGLTTRCATELHLSDGGGGGELAAGGGDAVWRATIATSKDVMPVPVSAPEDLADAITARTEALTDPRRAGGFSRERIVIHISHRDLPNLTLIDLPGLIRTRTYKYAGRRISLVPAPPQCPRL